MREREREERNGRESGEKERCEHERYKFWILEFRIEMERREKEET
jgi:hypothetical protein